MTRTLSLCTTALSAIILVAPDASGTTREEPPITAPSPSSNDDALDTVNEASEGEDVDALDAAQRPDPGESPASVRVLAHLGVERQATSEQGDVDASSTK